MLMILIEEYGPIQHSKTAVRGTGMLLPATVALIVPPIQMDP